MMFFQSLVLPGAIFFSFLLTFSDSFALRGQMNASLKRLLPPRRSSPSSTSPAIAYSDVALEDEKEVLKRRLPPIKRHHQMSKLEIEFRELLEGILYTESEIEAVANPRMRVIMEGISASYYEPAVYRAFEVLYEDYMPLRIAGRMVYRRLRDVMEESTEYKRSQLEVVIEATGMSWDEAESCWSTFIRLGESQRLPIQKLQRYMGQSALDYLQARTVHEAIQRICPDGDENESLSFQQLLIGFLKHGKGTTTLSSSPEQHHQNANFLQQVLNSDQVRLAEKADFSSRLDSKNRKYNDRYDEMLEQFGRWKAFIPDGQGRRLDILKGCFVGSENPAVVEALRIIYVDYGALRLSGDWIFKVVSTIMGSVERRQGSRDRQSS
ncbi:hypothetical protein IV203_000790 [Nitzschia inconspicua]|uniref:Uncharacterized protein n=1 Tax=Nitzschia inconspicua TaxID=303405 RepID=A0A9K3L5K9_9STRA|nr:hypothetical protein IV203_000790 [Nitzschia inconspicua]